ncbi:MAG: hypothetical protein HKN13_13870, partial [Rhodothermales bacterium]|nr:hypothetical protein [Rhodothermales bacterium]
DPLRETWNSGEQVVKLIGFDATEDHRTDSGGTYAHVKKNICPREGLPHYRDRYQVEYLLRFLSMDRDACIKTIIKAGLPVPPKSCCFF